MYVCLAFFFSDLTSCTISIIVYGVFKDRDAITVDVVVVLMKGYNFPVFSSVEEEKREMVVAMKFNICFLFMYPEIR